MDAGSGSGGAAKGSAKDLEVAGSVYGRLLSSLNSLVLYLVHV